MELKNLKYIQFDDEKGALYAGGKQSLLVAVNFITYLNGIFLEMAGENSAQVLLYKVGQAIGEGYAETLEKILETEKVEINKETLLREIYTAISMEAGWGIFRIKKINLEKCEIIVEISNSVSSKLLINSQNNIEAGILSGAYKKVTGENVHFGLKSEEGNNTFIFSASKIAPEEFLSREEMALLSRRELQEKIDDQTKEIKKAYEIKKKAYEDLQRLDMAKDQFMLATQHHLRTPLTIIKGYAATLMEKEKELTSKERIVFFERIIISIDRLVKLTNELLDITQAEIGGESLSIKPVDIKEIIQDIMAELDGEIKKKKQTSEILPKDKWRLVLADSKKIQMALFNIIDNAVKYTISGKISITAEARKTKLRIIIKDTGIGIDPQSLEGIFSRSFERGDYAQKLYTTGRGIGLYISANIIKNHKGKIWAESEGLGQGSSFFIELPLA